MNFLQMSVSGAIMILVIIVIRALAINCVPKKTFIVLWGIVLLRLLVPFSIPSLFSVYSLINSHIPASLRNTILASPAELLIAGDVLQGQTKVSISPYMIIWGIGMIACVLFFAISYFKCYKEFQESLPIKNAFLTKWIAEHKLSRQLEIRQSGRISSPLTYGVLKPIILMPKNMKWEDTKQIEYILAHEFVHVRRFDAATKLFLIAALCFHWFNPLVWAMYILFNLDIELSCDESVVHSFGYTTRSEYALTLISMEENKNSLTPLCNNFSKNSIEERIKSIMKIKKTSIAGIALAFALIATTTAVFATSATSLNGEDSPNIRDARKIAKNDLDENFSLITKEEAQRIIEESLNTFVYTYEELKQIIADIESGKTKALDMDSLSDNATTIFVDSDGNETVLKHSSIVLDISALDKSIEQN